MKRVIEPLNPEVRNKRARQLGQASSSFTAQSVSSSFEPKAKKPRVATSLPDIKQELVEQEVRNPIEASPLPLPVQLLSMQIKQETAGMEEERGSASVDEGGSKRAESALNPDIEERGPKRQKLRKREENIGPDRRAGSSEAENDVESSYEEDSEDVGSEEFSEYEEDSEDVGTEEFSDYEEDSQESGGENVNRTPKKRLEDIERYKGCTKTIREHMVDILGGQSRLKKVMKQQGSLLVIARLFKKLPDSDLLYIDKLQAEFPDKKDLVKVLSNKGANQLIQNLFKTAEGSTESYLDK